jgi:hypothetical protein
LIHEQATAAKAGDLDAYNKVLAAAASLSPINATAKAELREIEMCYDMDAAQLLTSRWADTVSGEDPGFSLDELVVELHRHSRPNDREAIVDTISGKGSTLKPEHMGIIGELCAQLSSEKNLRVRVRMIHALNVLLKQQFRPLDFEKVTKWWKLHSAEPRYKSPYGPLIEETSTRNPSLQDALNLLRSTLSRDPEAIYARCLGAEILIQQGRLEEAGEECKAGKRLSLGQCFSCHGLDFTRRHRQGCRICEQGPKEIARSGTSPFWACVTASSTAGQPWPSAAKQENSLTSVTHKRIPQRRKCVSHYCRFSSPVPIASRAALELRCPRKLSRAGTAIFSALAHVFHH